MREEREWGCGSESEEWEEELKNGMGTDSGLVRLTMVKDLRTKFLKQNSEIFINKRKKTNMEFPFNYFSNKTNFTFFRL